MLLSSLLPPVVLPAAPTSPSSRGPLLSADWACPLRPLRSPPPRPSTVAGTDSALAAALAAAKAKAAAAEEHMRVAALF
jgi:hypothetical protein